MQFQKPFGAFGAVGVSGLLDSGLKAEDHETAARYNPDRSYTIDITGHGARALDYLGVAHRFDEQLIKLPGRAFTCS